MSSKAITEYDAKRLLSFIEKKGIIDDPPLFTIPNADHLHLADLPDWMDSTKLVVKPDRLIKRRGKLNLLGLNLDKNAALNWIKTTSSKITKIDEAEERIRSFLVEPFYAHTESDEMYFAITSDRHGEQILFCDRGGVDVGDVDQKALKLTIPVGSEKIILNERLVAETLFKNVEKDDFRKLLTDFTLSVFDLYLKLHFTFLEINPLVITPTTPPRIRVIDLAAKLDEAAHFQCYRFWGGVNFPVPFGKAKSPEEKYVADLDAKTGASLKLTVLNPRGRVWTLVAGGGASVIFADTVVALAGDRAVLGNYGEYSGAPTKSLTYQYARTVLQLMLQHEDVRPKALLVGGGIANFTNVAETFDGIIEALDEFKEKIIRQQVYIYVRRGGPNYQEGLEKIKAAGEDFDIPIDVYGPETNMTKIVKLALNKIGIKVHNRVEEKSKVDTMTIRPHLNVDDGDWHLFTKETKAAVYGMQVDAVQNMLDFDFLSKRSPSVCCIIYPFASASSFKHFFFGAKDIIIPVYDNTGEALSKHGDVSVIVNFASSRSVLSSTREILDFPQIKAIGIIAEGVPERHTKELIFEAARCGVTIIGPATVGMIKPGCFRMGNTGGKNDNIIASRLYQAGSVAYVSRSGGLSNELNNIISHNCDGVYEGISIGGDRYPLSTFKTFMLRHERSPDCKIIVLLGEVGGTLEYEVVDAIRSGEITKPVVAWCTGTSAEAFPYGVQFGHAGASAGNDRETASAKNRAFREVGAFVPESFEGFGELLRKVFEKCVREKVFVPVDRIKPPHAPLDYTWARKLGIVRREPNFFSSISYEHKGELNYAGVPISQILRTDLGIGGVIGLLWFKKLLPAYICRFFEMVLIVIADHGPAVSAAHNTIVTARAGKDVISALIAGLVTVGPRFGGALDGAAKVFSWALKEGLSPEEFVERMRKEKRLIMGIGHKSKSLENPDTRVSVIVDYCRTHFKFNDILNYALEVEKITTRKKSNLILNVDGAIGVCFADGLRSSGVLSVAEIDDYVEKGSINALFVLGRSIGLIGHFLDQNRMHQPLYRHPMDDITIVGKEESLQNKAELDRSRRTRTSEREPSEVPASADPKRTKAAKGAVRNGVEPPLDVNLTVRIGG